MEQLQLIYFTLSIITFAVIGVVIMIMAGKDIFFAIKRKVFYRGCDILIANKNKQFTRYYKVPKDNAFKILGHTYITNPDKVMSLGEQGRKDVNLSLQSKVERLDVSIKRVEEKIKKLDELIKLAAEANKQSQVDSYNSMRMNLKEKIEILKKKKEDKEEVYYFERRPMFLYVEGDPVPKDLFEWMTEMDNVSLDNIVSRSLSQDPKEKKDMDKLWGFVKIMLIVAAVGAAVAAIFAFKNHSFLQQIAESQGITLKV